jgi:hypothetical protein
MRSDHYVVFKGKEYEIIQIEQACMLVRDPETLNFYRITFDGRKIGA